MLTKRAELAISTPNHRFRILKNTDRGRGVVIVFVEIMQGITIAWITCPCHYIIGSSCVQSTLGTRLGITITAIYLDRIQFNVY